MKAPVEVPATLDALAAVEPADVAGLRSAFAAATADLRLTCANFWQVGASTADRDDVIQEAMLRLWKLLSGEPEDGAAGPAERQGERPRTGEALRRLFRVIVRNVAVDRHRREARLIRPGNLDELGGDAVDSPASPAEPLPLVEAELWAVCEDAVEKYPWLFGLSFQGRLIRAAQRGRSLVAFAADEGVPSARVYKYWNRFEWGLAGILLVDDELRRRLEQPDLVEAARIFAEWLDRLEDAPLVRAVLLGENRSRIAARLGLSLAGVEGRLVAAKQALLAHAEARGGEKASRLAAIVTRAWERMRL